MAVISSKPPLDSEQLRFQKPSFTGFAEKKRVSLISLSLKGQRIQSMVRPLPNCGGAVLGARAPRPPRLLSASARSWSSASQLSGMTCGFVWPACVLNATSPRENATSLREREGGDARATTLIASRMCLRTANPLARAEASLGGIGISRRAVVFLLPDAVSACSCRNLRKGSRANHRSRLSANPSID